jgi:hypothetical protein
MPRIDEIIDQWHPMTSHPSMNKSSWKWQEVALNSACTIRINMKIRQVAQAQAEFKWKTELNHQWSVD